MKGHVSRVKKAVLSLVVILMPLLASAESIEINGICYNLMSKLRQAEVTSNPNKYSGSITIPATVTYDGVAYDVSGIDDNAFWQCTNLTSISIPLGVTNIGSSAFSYCSNLTSITIPESVERIGFYALTPTAWYENQPDGVIYAGKVLYSYKGTMPENTYVKVQDGTKSIAENAFFGRSDLTSITIPESVTIIGRDALGNTAWYENQPDGVVYAGKVLYSYKGTMPENTSIDVKNGTKGIAEYALRACTNLTSITIPESVSNIGSYAFSGCRNLAVINIPEGMASIESCAFSDCGNLTSITIPESVTSIESQAFKGCSNLITINISENSQLASIGGDAFFGCSSLGSITLQQGITSIEQNTFRDCSSLTSITIPEEVKSIGELAFMNCKSLNFITFPEGMTCIKMGAFGYCESLASITIPVGMQSIGDRAFHGCRSLAAITCETATPPTIETSNSFYGVDKSIPFYVPSNSVSVYQETQYWSEFTNILPLAKENEFILTVSSAGYATLYLDYAAEIPESVKVYISTSVDGDRLKMKQVTGVLPAGTGVIVRAKEGTYTFVESENEPANVEGNLLRGTAAKETITTESGYKYYVLAQKEGVVAMYKPMLTDGQFINNANKAYLALKMDDLGIFDDETNTEDEGGQLSNRLRFDFGETTDIEKTTDDEQQATIIYDLHGRRIIDVEGFKGLYIINGRKVVLK